MHLTTLNSCSARFVFFQEGMYVENLDVVECLIRVTLARASDQAT